LSERTSPGHQGIGGRRARRTARVRSNEYAESTATPHAKQLPLGPGGRPLCRRCNEEIKKGSGRRTFCSETCVVEWKVRTQPEFAAEQVYARDKGVCSACGRDCDALQRKIRVTKWARRKRRLSELGLPAYLLRRRRYWEVDHVQAVVEGGGSCGLENLRTLCWECHRKVTRELQVRRGKIRAA
jgi:5-methylcytosine-specific restriction protein A